MLTDEQIRAISMRAIDFHEGNEAGLVEGYKMGYADGVAAERKRCVEVCKDFVMRRAASYDTADQAWWACISDIDRGEDV